MLATPRPGEPQRRHGGLNTEDVADRLDARGLSYATIRNWENGASKPEGYQVEAIAKALEIPLAFFTLTRERLLAALEDAGAPGLPGATGRRAGALRPSQGDPERPASREEGESSHEAL